MRKVFIGCGAVVLVLLGVIGFIAWKLYPVAREWQMGWTAAIEQLNELDTRSPFDPAAQTQLDTRRFALVLDVRAGLNDYFEGVARDIESLNRDYEESDEVGLFDMVGGVFRAATPTLGEFAARLRAIDMGPTEFAFHTRVLWSALRRASTGVGGEALAPLRDSYDRFKAHYERMRREVAEMPPLDDVLADVPAGITAEAGLLLERDLQRALDGLRIVELDHLFLQPIRSIEDVSHVSPAPRAPRPVEPSAGGEPAPR